MNKIRELRIARGMRQIDLAEKLGVQRVTVTKWENGTNTPKTKDLPKIAAALQCNVIDLLKIIE